MLFLIAESELLRERVYTVGKRSHLRHKKRPFICSAVQRNHGGEALLQQRDKQQTNNKQTQQIIIIPCQDLKDPRANKLSVFETRPDEPDE